MELKFEPRQSESRAYDLSHCIIMPHLGIVVQEIEKRINTHKHTRPHIHTVTYIIALTFTFLCISARYIRVIMSNHLENHFQDIKLMLGRLQASLWPSLDITALATDCSLYISDLLSCRQQALESPEIKLSAVHLEEA